MLSASSTRCHFHGSNPGKWNSFHCNSYNVSSYLLWCMIMYVMNVIWLEKMICILQVMAKDDAQYHLEGVSSSYIVLVMCVVDHYMSRSHLILVEYNFLQKLNPPLWVLIMLYVCMGAFCRGITDLGASRAFVSI